MIDREKVINELVEHIENALSIDSDYVDCVRTDLLQTVVGMLKKQEARPLSVDHIHSGIVYWMENSNVTQVWPVEMHHIRNAHLLKGPEWEDSYGDVWKMADYNKTWRCWTAKPTEEQRIGVKWDE